MNDPFYVQIVTTAGSADAAQAIAAGLVGERLAACGQVSGPIRSTYRWRGAVEQAEEWVCTIKTTTAAAPRAQEWIRRHHSYDTPEITITPIVGGSDDYLEWIAYET